MPMSVSGFVPAGVQHSIMSSSSLTSLIIEHFALCLTIVSRNQNRIWGRLLRQTRRKQGVDTYALGPSTRP
jgi:hypothetical protein